jgi:hypothetical protein
MKLAAILLPVMLCAQTFDVYGGNTALASPSNSTGVWAVEKYTVAGAQRWLMTTPAGYGFFCGGQYAITKPPSLNATAKYGSNQNWESAVLARYIGWGFNCMGEYSDYVMQNDMTAGLLGSTKLPYWREAHFVRYAVLQTQFAVEQEISTDAVKDLHSLTQTAVPYSNIVADGFDPVFPDYIQKVITYMLSENPQLYGDGWAKSLTNLHMIGMWADDQDYQYGFGPGPDECASSDGVYHAHISWMALAAPMNAYAQWLNQGDIYSTNNWFFNDTAVYSKQNLVAYLKTTYSNNITALNTAWGSSYTAFDSAATRYTGETVGTTDGIVTSLSHTLAHTSGLSRGTLLLKAGGVNISTDLPQSAGVLIGRWPDGTTTISGTVNYTTGDISISAQSSEVDQFDSDGGTDWGTVNLDHGGIVPGSLVIRRLPSPSEDCRLADDATSHGTIGTQQETCSPPYTISGTIDYSAGVISDLVISPALTVSQGISIGYNWDKPIPNSCGVGGIDPCTVTVDYDVNGWGVGTTLADENGTLGAAWLGDYFLAKPGNPAGLTPTASLGAWTDLDAWLYNYTDQYMTNTVDVIKANFPGNLVTQGAGGHYGCPRKQMVLAIAPHVDVLNVGQQSQSMVDRINDWGLTDIPIIDSWEGIGAQDDSAVRLLAEWNNSANSNYDTQTLRGAAMATLVNSALTIRAEGNPIYQNVGIKFWAYADTALGENANYGLVTFDDNAYDGVENVTSYSGPCSAPLASYTCGGETYTWADGSTGDAITPIKAALAGMWQTMLGSVTPASSMRGGMVRGGTVR